MARDSAGGADGAAQWRIAAPQRRACGQPAAGPLAKASGFVIDVRRVAQAVEEAGGIEGGVGTAAFAVDQQQAEGAGPEFGRRHHQRETAPKMHQSRVPTMETLNTSERITIPFIKNDSHFIRERISFK